MYSLLRTDKMIACHSHGTWIAAPRSMNGEIRIAAMADLHYGRMFKDKFSEIFSSISENADILLLCGDVIDYGLPDEAQNFVDGLNRNVGSVPVIAVLGNHEYESGQAGEVARIFREAGIKVLDGDSCTILGIGFAGVKGFGGGFGDRMLAPWGEPIIKDFVREAVDQAVKLESALARLRSLPRIVLLHYSPISSTVVGEPPETFPFLGSSRLEDALSRHAVTAVFHGHAHRGTIEGRTRNKIPVYNVATELLEHAFPDQLPYLVLKVPQATVLSGLNMA